MPEPPGHRAGPVRIRPLPGPELRSRACRAGPGQPPAPGRRRRTRTKPAWRAYAAPPRAGDGPPWWGCGLLVWAGRGRGAPARTPKVPGPGGAAPPRAEGVGPPPVGAVDPRRDLQLFLRADGEMGAHPAKPPHHRDAAHPLLDQPV